MTVTKFYEYCEEFDWYYMYSDDNRVFSTWNYAYKVMAARATLSPELNAIWEAFHAWAYSGPSYGTERAPYPERPQQKGGM